MRLSLPTDLGDDSAQALAREIPRFLRLLELFMTGVMVRGQYMLRGLATDKEAAAAVGVSLRQWRRWCQDDPEMFREAGRTVLLDGASRRRWHLARLDEYLAHRPRGRRRRQEDDE